MHSHAAGEGHRPAKEPASVQGHFLLLVRNSVHKPRKALKESLKATDIREQNTGNNSHVLQQLEQEVRA